MKAKLISQPRPERVVLGKHLPLKTPFVVYIEPSGFCNLRCVFCPQTSKLKGMVRDIMTFKLWKKAIDDLDEFPEKVKLLRVCGNGEPMSNPDLVEMLKYARESDKIERIELITNGTLLEEPYTLTRYVDRIIISIEGLNAEEYQEVSGVKIDFEELVNNIRKLHANSGSCTIHLKIHHKADKERFFQIFGDICDEIYVENLINMWPEFESKHATKKYRYGGKGVKKKVCVQIFKGFQIQANGEVVPCCVDWRRINILGDIRKKSVKEIWDGKNLNLFRMRHLFGFKDTIEPCKSCTMNDLNEIDNIDKDAIMILEQL